MGGTRASRYGIQSKQMLLRIAQELLSLSDDDMENGKFKLFAWILDMVTTVDPPMYVPWNKEQVFHARVPEENTLGPVPVPGPRPLLGPLSPHSLPPPLRTCLALHQRPVVQPPSSYFRFAMQAGCACRQHSECISLRGVQRP